MSNAKSIIGSRREEIGRDVKIKAIQAWSRDFFSDVETDVINSDGDVSVGSSEDGWIFVGEFKSSYFIVDCDHYCDAKWQSTPKLKLYYSEIEVETIGDKLSDHFQAVIDCAKFIK